MLNSLKRPTLPWFVLLTLAGGLVAAVEGCGGDGAKDFGGNETGGAHGATGGTVGSGSGGNVGPGSGGATATGGMFATGGNGGDPATGGTTGTGGRASGGAPGTGGAGATATGGRPATGGVSGTGGTGSGASGGHGGTGATTGSGGSGGRPGTGGTTGTGGSSVTCDTLAADYQGEMPNARMCNTITGLTVPQCQMSAAASLGCGSGCIVYVQDSAKLTEIQKRWNAMDCQSTIRVCPAVACVQAKPGYCYASVGSATAQCQSGPKN